MRREILDPSSDNQPLHAFDWLRGRLSNIHHRDARNMITQNKLGHVLECMDAETTGILILTNMNLPPFLNRGIPLLAYVQILPTSWS